MTKQYVEVEKLKNDFIESGIFSMDEINMIFNKIIDVQEKVEIYNHIKGCKNCIFRESVQSKRYFDYDDSN